MNETDSPLLQLPNTYRAFYGAFPSLYSIQKQAISPILKGRDLVLQCATGSGKTEAVLAPCLERIIRSGRSEALIYIVPTRALAFDLKRRFENIVTRRLGLCLAIRTGDIKRSGGERPDLMLTTPESLDVLLGSSNPDLRGFVSRVRMMIIDEVHLFVYKYRGRQLSYLITRLERRFSRPLQKMALSATIADVDSVIRFFGFQPDTVRCTASVQRDIVPHLIHLKDEDREFVALLDDLYNIWKYRKILIFANSRGKCDRLFAMVNREGRFQGVSELHYSNLKTRERRAAERRFRKRNHALCIATSTLELGIDIGDVDGVILYEPPDSVSAFLQRIGRSNRRQNQIYFWGICRGERAGLQLLRFLGLLGPARQSAVEFPLPKTLPSVLVQQVLSCLYEKKRISLSAMQELFPQQRKTLDTVFDSLFKQGWVSKTHVKGLFQGGWRYRRCRFERKIWGNFPETEENYTIELPGEAIADIPWSIVRQLDPGDRVCLAGKRLLILRIDTGERKRVLAQVTTRLDDKEIVWLGAGCHVSYEVAQSMRMLLKSPDLTENKSNFGLFARTRKLFSDELKQDNQSAILGNGIKVFLGRDGFFRYRTFLGSIGNLILQWTIRHDIGAKLKDLSVLSDEIGLNCSHLIHFNRLNLPLNREAFGGWVRQHFKTLRALFSLNSFCSALPEDLLIKELTDFIFDSRIAEAFTCYLRESSEIVSGNLNSLDSQIEKPASREVLFIDTPVSTESLLAAEKERWGIDQKKQSLLEEADFCSRPLTGTMIGEYFRHRQCNRWFGFNFLRSDQQPPRRTRVDSELKVLQMEQGRRYETDVLEHLRDQSDALIMIEEDEALRKPRPLKERFDESITRLQELIQMAKTDPEKHFYLGQGVFILESVLKSGDSKLRRVDGIGIPDLIRVSAGKQGPILEIGDIKSSLSPRYNQKWQVAFYSMLLSELIRLRKIPLQAGVASAGFLLTRPKPGTEVKKLETEADFRVGPEEHIFDLHPYWAAFPSLFQNLAGHLLQPASEWTYQLQGRCVTCNWFEFCYQQAIETEDVQFLPQLSPGELWKMRELELNTIETASAWFKSREAGSDQNGNFFSPHQKERIQRRVAALKTNRIALREKKTRFFPANISTSIFIHLVRDPLSSMPCALGWRVIENNEKIKDACTWMVVTEEKRSSVWQDFSGRFLAVWEESIGQGKGPHIFHFGRWSRQALRDWGEAMGEKNRLDFLWNDPCSHWTDLHQMVGRHFDLPVPGNLTLFAISRILGLNPEPESPESLFHGDNVPYTSINDQKKIIGYLEDSLILQDKLRQWASHNLESDLKQQNWEVFCETEDNSSAHYLNFLEEERRQKEEDILSLQDYALHERVERFRAIGPLTFLGTTLDHEGCFLYNFKIAQETGLSRFREGDFLKLAPEGISDLQSGFSVILTNYDRNAGCLSIRSRQNRLSLSKQISYSLEEDLTDWNEPKLKHVVRTVFSSVYPHPLFRLIFGQCPDEQSDEQPAEQSGESLPRVQRRLQRYGAVSQLNAAQQRALELPFRHRLSLIEGPPGTGKTHLLGWILISLVQQAYEAGRPLRIAVSALTHQAIDHVLRKVVRLVNDYQLQKFPARCIKFGRWKDRQADEENSLARVESSDSMKDILKSPYLILGATGYGLYQLFESRQGKFPQVFDWVIFDEASQILVPQALLSLIYGKGNFLFLGDVKQLPPIVRGEYENDVQQSILRLLLDRYPLTRQIRLNLTYRMNKDLCMFPSRMWYNDMLQPAPANADSRLSLSGTCGDNPRPSCERSDEAEGRSALESGLIDKILDPEKPVVLVLTDHQGCHQESEIEAEIMAQLAFKLMIDFELSANRLALISPHRAQNNAITKRLSELLEDKEAHLPLIDTVERVQGAERDVILFAFTTSDPDHTASEFLNNPNRFNVAITRARHKLIVIGSNAFFSAIPDTEKALQANRCFKEFLRYCREIDSVFLWKDQIL
jgi:superfamily II DNA/RNA helicase/predicted RecB family nuclease